MCNASKVDVKKELNGRKVPVGRENAIKLSNGVRIFKYAPGEREKKRQQVRNRQLKEYGFYYKNGKKYSLSGAEVSGDTLDIKPRLKSDALGLYGDDNVKETLYKQ